MVRSGVRAREGSGVRAREGSGVRAREGLGVRGQGSVLRYGLPDCIMDRLCYVQVSWWIGQGGYGLCNSQVVRVRLWAGHDRI